MERQIITVDISPHRGMVPQLRVSQGDIGRPLGVYIMQDGAALDCSSYSADLYILKSDGNYYVTPATVDSTETNLIIWSTELQETPVAGECAGQIRITHGEDDIGTARFVEYVEASPGFSGAGSESAVESIKEYVRQAAASAETASGAASSATGSASAASGSASAAASSASAAAGSASSAHTDAETASQAAQTAQDVADSIPEDYSTLSEDVTGLKSALINTDASIENRIGAHIDQSSNLMPVARHEASASGVTSVYENGTFTFSGTGTAATTINILTFMLLPGQYTIKAIPVSGTVPNLRFFDSTEQTVVILSYDLRNTPFTFTVDGIRKYTIVTQTAANWTENSVVNIQLSKGDTADIFESPLAGSAVDSVAREKTAFIIDNGFEESPNFLPIEAQTNVINDVTASYVDGVLTMTGTPSATGVIPQVDFSLPAGTYTAIARFTQGVGDALKLINMTDNQVISNDLRNAVTFTLSKNTNIRIRSVMGSTSWTYNFTCEIMVNSGETALDFVAPSFLSAVDKVAREKLSHNPLTSRLTGQKLVTAGDSITYGDGASSASTTYGALAAKYLGMEYLNIAMSGRTMADVHVNGVTRNGFAVDRYLLVPDDTDYLTIFFGFNDGAYGKVSMEDDYCMEQYGKYYSQCTEEEKAEADAHANWFEVFVGTVNSTDKKTWCGAWRFVLDYFVNTKSIPHIGVFIPYGTDTRMTNPLKQLCTEFAVPYFDTTDVQTMPTIGFSYMASIPVNTHNRALYTLDGLHPNDAGYVRMANAIIPWLERI